LTASDENALVEGACDEVRVDTDDVLIFGQPPERDWIVINGTFDADSNWTKGTGWTISGGTATAAAGSASDLTQATDTENPDDPLIDGETYILIFTISGYSAGSVTPKLGTTSGTARSANGTYVEAIEVGTDPDVIFSKDATFVGSIDNVFVIPANGPYKAGSSEPDSYSHIVGVAATSDPGALLTTVRVEAGWYRRAGATELG
jgi:hypothetical protein